MGHLWKEQINILGYDSFHPDTLYHKKKCVEFSHFSKVNNQISIHSFMINNVALRRNWKLTGSLESL